ncbi:MAG: hypothetical protein JNJ61_21100 [Anaerolineae bacterium]|nr:hypothetical protein [Anaerolineae bacterium]
MYDLMTSTTARAALQQLAEDQLSYAETPVETRRSWVQQIIDRMRREPAAEQPAHAPMPTPKALANPR